MVKKISIIGARGYVAEELIKLIINHDGFELSFIGSRKFGGEMVEDILPSLKGQNIKFDNIQPENINDFPSDLYVLAVPNGFAKGYINALENTSSKIIDLSYDMRFDENWVYGLTEKNRTSLKGASRVSNPGCYATGGQLGLAPLLDNLSTMPTIFGVSGYSGAGRTPSDNNNPDRLRDNFLPYQLTGHGHEAEISHHFGQDVSFIPHVAPHFRGISLTIQVSLKSSLSAKGMKDLFEEYYNDEALIEITASIPEIQSLANTPKLFIGGFKIDERHANKCVFVVTLDNLLKGAASQAMQNINLMFGLPELEGIIK